MSLSNSLLSLISTCSVCQNCFNSNDRPPKFLNCHHRYCLECCVNLVEDGFDQIKCPHCRRLTPVSAGRICVDLDLHTDHDFLTLVQNLQQPSVGPTPGGSGAVSKREKAINILSSEDSTSSSSSKSGKKKSRKRKALKKTKTKNKKRRQAISSSTDNSSTSESEDSDGSSEFEKKKKKKFKRKNNYTSVKSEMDAMMRKSKSALLNKGKSGNKEEKVMFLKDVFLVSDADARELPPSVEHDNLERAGLGLRCDVEFKNSGSAKHVLRVFKRIFPRMEEVSRFYICTKAQGVSRNLTIQHYSTPSAPVLKRLSGKLIVLVPIKTSLPYESSDEGVDCDVCHLNIPLRQWADHIDRCMEQASRTQKRRTY